MQRPGDYTLDTNSVGVVFAGDVDGRHPDQRPDEAGSHGSVVRQSATDFQQSAGAGKTLFVGQLPFSNYRCKSHSIVAGEGEGELDGSPACSK